MEDNLNDATNNGTDTTQIDPSSTQTDQQDTTLDNDQQNHTTDTTGTDKTQNQEVEGDDKDVPAHLVPRFKEVIEEKNLLKRQLELLQDQIQEKNGKSSLEREKEQENKPLDDLPDEEYAPFFDKLPVREYAEPKFDEEGNLVEGIATLTDFAQALRKDILKDVVLFNDLLGKEQEKTQQEQQEADRQVISQVQKTFEGDKETVTMFTKWAEELEKTPTEQNKWIMDLSLPQQANYFKQHVLQGLKEKASSAKKDAASRLGNGNPASGTTKEGVDFADVRKKNIQDFYN